MARYTYTVGVNMAGYLPESEPLTFTNFNDAWGAFMDICKDFRDNGFTQDWRGSARNLRAYDDTASEFFDASLMYPHWVVWVARERV